MATRAPVVLIPPSEGKATGGAGPVWTPGEMRFDLDASRLRVMKTLGARLRRELEAAPTAPAMERYTGVLYGALSYGALDQTQRVRIDASVVIFSALWGL